MNIPEIPVHRMLEKRMYVVAAVLGVAAISGILLTVQDADGIFATEQIFGSWDLSGMLEITSSEQTPSKIISQDSQLPKFSIDEYLQVSSIEAMLNQQ